MGFLGSSQSNREALLSKINYLTSVILLKLFEDGCWVFQTFIFVRFYIGWRVEQSISYKGVETSP